MHLRTRILLILGLTSVLMGCASISVKNERNYGTVAKKPHLIYVSGFNMTKGEFNVDREGVDLTAFKRDLQKLMQDALVEEISEKLVKAVPSVKGHDFDPRSGWVIRGEFTKVNQGSRFLRSAIGLGAGGTKMETRIYVYDLTDDSGQPILTFSTTGGSNAEPGAVSGIGPTPVFMVIGAGFSGLGGLAHGVTEDTTRTAREITAQLSDYMHHRGWITDEQWIKPKKLGE